MAADLASQEQRSASAT